MLRVSSVFKIKLPSAPTLQLLALFRDIGPRDLSHQISVSAGVTAESCTAACEANGFGLAGLEFGQECCESHLNEIQNSKARLNLPFLSAGCDINYLPYGTPAPDTDCNIPCKANTSELCGAGNRIAVYQNVNGTPLDSNACIVGRDFTNFHLQAVPVTGSPPSAVPGGPIRQVYAVTLNFNGNNAPQYTILSVCGAAVFEYNWSIH